MDAKLLKPAQDKHSNKRTDQGKHTVAAEVAEPQQYTNMPLVDTMVPNCFSTAALSTFKKASKRRRLAISGRSGIKDRWPRPEDSNRFKDLIASRRGYSFTARILRKILRMFRAAAGPKGAGLYQKIIWLLWSSERENSILT